MLGAILDAKSYLERVCQELHKVDLAEIQAMGDAIHESYSHDRFVFICGNGGSGSNSSHFCEDLGKGTLRSFEDQKRLKVLSLTDNTPYILAWANDEGYDRIFTEQLKNLASPDDLLIAISGSGNSQNILHAVAWANAHGLRTFGLTGFNGGQLRRMAQQCLHVPIDDMGIVESIHLTVFHYVLDDLYARFGREMDKAGVEATAVHS